VIQLSGPTRFHFHREVHAYDKIQWLRYHSAVSAADPYAAVWATVFSPTPCCRAARWWKLNLPMVYRIHRDGDNVAVALLVRLRDLAKMRNAQFLAVALATNGRIGNNRRLPPVTKRAIEQGVEVLDLATPVSQLQPEQLLDKFRPGGHYAPEMNQ
jgi:hypothetical protein